MYHPAKVEHVIEKDDPVVMVRTWDGNTFTLNVDENVDAADLAEGAVVLIDYTSDDRFDVPKPRQVVSHVLDRDDAEAIWETYEQLFESSKEQQTAAMQQMAQGPFDGNYIG